MYFSEKSYNELMLNYLELKSIQTKKCFSDTLLTQEHFDLELYLLLYLYLFHFISFINLLLIIISFILFYSYCHLFIFYINCYNKK